MNTQVAVVIALAVAGSVGGAPGQDSAKYSPNIPVLTVCETLRALRQYDSKAVVLVGKVVSTDEGRWLREDCEHNLITDDYSWPNIVSLSYVRSDVKPPPSIPSGFRWDEDVLKAKLKQVQKTTKLQVLKQYNYTDKWFAVFVRFETRLPLRVVQGKGYGFGHLNAAPAQLISSSRNYLELKSAD